MQNHNREKLWKKETKMRSKMMRLPGNRMFEQLRNQYEVEKGIAEKLRKTDREGRKRLYKTMYDELFRQCPDHPRLKLREDAKMTEVVNQRKSKLIENFINKSTVFVEFGCGDCRFAIDVSNRVRFAYGVDISDQRGLVDTVPNNFALIIYDGYDLEMQESSVDVAFSDQLIEHLHPEDTESHFQLVRKILKPRGVYVFRTPHRLSGPHDVSGYFSDEPEGFHLKEWTYGEVAKMLKNLRYLSWSGYWNARGIRIKMPFSYFIINEYILKILTKGLRRIVSKYLLPSITMVAVK